MPKVATPLTDKQIQNAKPREKNYYLIDGKGLYLIVTPKGGKWWRLKYILNAKTNILSLGTYPVVSLLEAREMALKLKKDIKQGIDPSLERKAQKEVIKEQEWKNILDEKSQIHKIVDGWLETLSSMQYSTLKKERSRIENNILKHFATYNKEGFIVSSKSITQITRAEIAQILSDISKDRAETADRLFSHCNRIWLYAVSLGYIDINIMANISKKDTLSKVQTKHYSKITDEKILSDLLISINNYNNSIQIKMALTLLCHVPLRAKNLKELEWEQLDFGNRTITIPRKEMKTQDNNLTDFVMPLSNQVIKLLQECKVYFGNSRYILPSPLNQNHHINSDSINRALKVMGFDTEPKKQTVHSFRGTFRSLVETNLHLHKMPFEIREAVLDHHEANMAVRAYTHKANHINQMRELLQWWSDFLDTLRK